MKDNRMTTEYTETHQSKWSDSLYRPLDTKTKWVRYLSKSAIDAKSLPNVDQYRLALTEYMHQHELNGRHLFHLTLTYKLYADRIYSESDVNTFFINFYVRHFLPHLLKTRNIHTNVKKKIQPICMAFVDEHEPMSVAVHGTDPIQYDFSDRLHHHAILAVPSETLNRVSNLVGTNTFDKSRYANKIMTSDLRECEPMRLLYASKMMWKYPDFMSFPDKFHREHHKYTYQ